MAWAYLRTWWMPTSDQLLAQSEAALLRHVPCEVRLDDVPTGRGHFIHTVRAKAVKSKVAADGLAPLVLLHGYFMGAATWAFSLAPLAETGREVLAIDWPGYGCSSRPAFPLGGGVEACETYFVEGIEAWRASLGLDRMVLIGHSFGGYFAACYAMKHPGRVEALILASPVGMGEGSHRLTDPAQRARLSWWRRALLRLGEGLWDNRYTPQAVVRLFGPLGGRLTRGYAERRFAGPRAAGTMEVEQEALGGYLHQLAVQPACSEYCLGELLKPGAYPRTPLAPRLTKRLRQLGSEAPPVALIYGDEDWMDVGAGAWLAEELRAAPSGPNSAAGGRPAEVLIQERSGHQLFLDNPRAFNAAVRRALGLGPPAAPGLYRPAARPGAAERPGAWAGG